MICQSTQELTLQGMFDSCRNQVKKKKKKSHAAIFEVKFGKKKKAEASITNSRERTADTLFSDLESVALAIEGSDLNTLEDNPLQGRCHCWRCQCGSIQVFL